MSEPSASEGSESCLELIERRSAAAIETPGTRDQALGGCWLSLDHKVLDY